MQRLYQLVFSNEEIGVDETVMKKLFLLIYAACIVSLISSNGCSSAEQSSQTLKPIGENIPPGSAVVLCQLNSFEDKGNFYLLDVKVKQVTGYGSATENIDPDSNLKLQMKKELIKLESLKKGAEFELEIRQPMMSMGDEKNVLWTVSQLFK
ncbi:MAG: hypothetical protein AB1298_00305 [Bacteroidota bacterium]